MWELDHKEGWVPKNLMLPTVVWEKALENLLDSKEIKPVNLKGDQSWIFIGRTDDAAEAPILWPPDVKSWLVGKDLMLGTTEGRRRRGRQRDEMVGWHHRLNGCDFEQASGDSEGHGGLACCSPWGCWVRHDWTTEWQPMVKVFNDRARIGMQSCYKPNLTFPSMTASHFSLQ